MRPARLHPGGRDEPECIFEVELGPFRAPPLAGPAARQSDDLDEPDRLPGVRASARSSPGASSLLTAAEFSTGRVFRASFSLALNFRRMSETGSFVNAIAQRCVLEDGAHALLDAQPFRACHSTVLQHRIQHVQDFAGGDQVDRLGSIFGNT